MNDIVENLTRRQEYVADALAMQAADEITRLRAENDKLRNAILKLRTDLVNQRAELDALKGR